jgi:hypothetical protein
MPTPKPPLLLRAARACPTMFPLSLTSPPLARPPTRFPPTPTFFPPHRFARRSEAAPPIATLRPKPALQQPAALVCRTMFPATGERGWSERRRRGTWHIGDYIVRRWKAKGSGCCSSGELRGELL